MPRKPRIEINGYYHIVNRGVGALEFYPVEGEQHDRVKETLEISELVKESRKVLRGETLQNCYLNFLEFQVTHWGGVQCH